MVDNARIDLLESRLGVRFQDRRLALQSLTHRTWRNENRRADWGDNERLEFLGDAVIDLAVSQRLMERLPDASEGLLSRLRAAVVEERGLAEIARSIQLGELLLLGRGEERTGGREKASLLADALEAVIGAVYWEGGMAAADGVVERLFHDALDRALERITRRDAKSRLQELAQGLWKEQPRYEVLEERGPEHAKTFVVELRIGGARFGVGEGTTKKEAEQMAAGGALDALEALAAERRKEREGRRIPRNEGGRGPCLQRGAAKGHTRASGRPWFSLLPRRGRR